MPPLRAVCVVEPVPSPQGTGQAVQQRGGAQRQSVVLWTTVPEQSSGGGTCIDDLRRGISSQASPARFPRGNRDTAVCKPVSTGPSESPQHVGVRLYLDNLILSVRGPKTGFLKPLKAKYNAAFHPAFRQHLGSFCQMFILLHAEPQIPVQKQAQFADYIIVSA
jgi:hypothetical protein